MPKTLEQLNNDMELGLSQDKVEDIAKAITEINRAVGRTAEQALEDFIEGVALHRPELVYDLVWVDDLDGGSE